MKLMLLSLAAILSSLAGASGASDTGRVGTARATSAHVDVDQDAEPSDRLLAAAAPRYRFWACQHADGFTVYNEFRAHRTASEVRAYFDGRGGSPDCHAICYVDGRAFSVCYPAQADDMKRLHGKIVRVFEFGSR